MGPGPGNGGGGSGGGASGSSSSTGNAGTNGLGGGGGGNRGYGPTVGGNGIVIIRRVTAESETASGGTVTTDGSDSIHTFTSSGTYIG